MSKTISRKQWNNYISLLRKINDKASNEILNWMQKYIGDGLIDTSIRDQDGNNIIDISYKVAGVYGNASASVSAQMCEAMAELSEVITPVELAELPTYHEVAKTVNGVLKTSQNREELSSAVGRLVKKTGMQTTLLNARKGRAQCAWVPNGDTCAFCIMLASRGWRSVDDNPQVEHLHSNCDCTYAIRYNNETEIAGYDPEAYYEEYKDAEGRTTEEKLNSMRRSYYKRNKKEILKQKADAEEKREELNASQAEETNVN